MIKKLKKFFILTLCLAVILTAFSGCDLPGANSSASPESGDATTTGEISDDVFSLTYYTGETLNPITGTSQANLDIDGLIFECLFDVDQSYTAQPSLCESYSTNDYITYVLNIRQGVKFSDGSTMTAADVAYSLAQEKGSGSAYSSRLSSIKSATATGTYTVTITLISANSSLPCLLGVPVIKNGTMNNTVPIGTGPYVLTNGEDETYLDKNQNWWQGLSLPLDRIYLYKSQSPTGIVDDFASGSVDISTADLTDTVTLGYNGDYELRDYPTTILQFIGFNTKTSLFSDAKIRQAVGYGIDRKSIAGGVLSGHADPVAIAVNPSSTLYNESLDTQYAYSMEQLSTLLANAGVSDSNNDGVLDCVRSGKRVSFKLDLIVNSENTFKAEAADYIATTLKLVGIEVTVRKLDWDDYVNALNRGDYDMYYGEVRLTPDFDISSLVKSGGSLNYGKYSDSQMNSLLAAFSAASPDTKAEAATQLYTYLAQQAPIVPILFKSRSVLTHGGEVSDITPTEQNVFYKFDSWTIKLD